MKVTFKPLTYNSSITAIITVLTILIANKTPILNKSLGRIWCYYAAFTPLLFIGLYYFNRV